MQVKRGHRREPRTKIVGCGRDQRQVDDPGLNIDLTKAPEEVPRGCRDVLEGKLMMSLLDALFALTVVARETVVRLTRIPVGFGRQALLQQWMQQQLLRMVPAETLTHIRLDTLLSGRQ